MGFRALSFGLSHVGGLGGPPHMSSWPQQPLANGPLLGWGPYWWLDGLHNQVQGPPYGLMAIGLAIVVGLDGLVTSGSYKLHVGAKCLAW